MPHRLLFIEAASSPLSDAMGQLRAAAGGSSERTAWDSLDDPSRLRWCGADLLVPVALQASREARGFRLASPAPDSAAGSGRVASADRRHERGIAKVDGTPDPGRALSLRLLRN